MKNVLTFIALLLVIALTQCTQPESDANLSQDQKPTTAIESPKRSEIKSLLDHKDAKIANDASAVYHSTTAMAMYVTGLQDAFIQKAGGLDENGTLKNKKNYDVSIDFFIQQGAGYELEEKLKAYTEELNQLSDDFDFTITQSGEEDFAHSNFDHTPAIAALAVLEQLSSEIFDFEKKAATLLLAKK